MITVRRVGFAALLSASVAFMAVGIELWSSVTSDEHTRERVYASCPALAAPAQCPFRYENVATGLRPNHIPGAIAFLIGATGAR